MIIEINNPIKSNTIPKSSKNLTILYRLSKAPIHIPIEEIQIAK